MSKVIENYILQEVIGSGQYGKVYKAKNMKNDGIVAIKVVKLEKFREVPKLHEFTINEIQTLSRIDNQNIVKFIEMLKTQNNMYLIYDFCNGDTLEALLQKRKFLTEPETMKIFAQMLNAFRSLAKDNILHRDLKPSNILFNDAIVKVADFGFCKSLLHTTDLTQTMVGSPIYMAPEVLKGCSYNCKADVWSLGVVLYECLFGFCPYEDKSIARLIMQIDNKEVTFPRHINQISRKCEDLIKSMLQVDPRKRVDWNQLLTITFYEENVGSSKVLPANLPSMIKKQSSSNLSHQTNTHSNNVLQDRTNMQERTNMQDRTPQQDEKWQQNNLRLLLRERNKIVFLTQMVSFILEQNTSSNIQNIQNQQQNLTFSQKSVILAYLIMKQACGQIEIIKKQLDSEHCSKNEQQNAIMNLTKEKQEQFDRFLHNKWDDFVQTNEYKQFSTTFLRESEQLLLNLESFKNEAQKILRHLIQMELSQQIRAEIMVTKNEKVDLKLLNTILVLYAEECRERMQNLNEDLYMKQLLVLSDLVEIGSLNDFFDKNFGDINVRLNDQRYFDQMRRLSKENLNDLFNQRLVSARIRLAKQ